MIGDGGIGRDHAVRQTIFEEVSDLLLPRTSRLRSLQRPLGLPHCQVSQRHVFNEENALAVTKLGQRPHNLLMAINRVSGKILVPLDRKSTRLNSSHPSLS